MAELPSPTSDLSEARPRPLNFSRPRPTLHHPSNNNNNNSNNNNTNNNNTNNNTNNNRATEHSIPAFHDPNRTTPARPRYSNSTHTSSTSSNTSASSDSAWNGRPGTLQSLRPGADFDALRYQTLASPATSRTNTAARLLSSRDAAPDPPLLAVELPGVEPAALPRQKPRGVPVELDETWEDSASHHTVSVDGEPDMPASRTWRSSQYDTSALSVADIYKLRKKGVDPALYAEMKAARKGSGRWIGPLAGNTYIG